MKQETSIFHQAKMTRRQPIGLYSVRDDDAADVAVRVNFSRDLLPVCYRSYLYELEFIRDPYPLRYPVKVFAEDNQMLLIVAASRNHRTNGFPLLDHCWHALSRLVVASEPFYHEVATTQNALPTIDSDYTLRRRAT